MVRPRLYPPPLPAEAHQRVHLPPRPPGPQHPKHVSGFQPDGHRSFDLFRAIPRAAEPPGIPSLCLSGCGGVLSDSEGSFSSPNHPGSYPPNLLCVWVIRVAPPSLVQIHVTSLTVEGPSPCLFDWLEVQEQIEQSAVVTRWVGPQMSPETSVCLQTQLPNALL